MLKELVSNRLTRKPQRSVVSRVKVLERSTMSVIEELENRRLFAAWYVDPNGIDDPSRGGLNAPWRSVAYAAGRVATPGDTIRMNAGTYVESSSIYMNLGVNLVGNGSTGTGASTITVPLGADNTVDGIIKALSSSNVNGNHTFSDFAIDGAERTAKTGIWAVQRNNVEIKNCRFVNMYERAIQVQTRDQSSVDFLVPPNFMTGIKIHDNSFLNNTKNGGGYWSGNIQINHLQGGEIYNNTIVENRGDDSGYGIKAVDSGGWLKGTLIHHNNYSGPGFRIAIEVWHTSNHVKIYGNVGSEISLSLDGQKDPGFATTVEIYDNVVNFGPNSTNSEVGIEVHNNTDVRIHDNTVINAGSAGAIGVFSSAGEGYTPSRNVHIYRNSFLKEQSFSGFLNSRGICFWAGGETVSDFYIYNNTFDNLDVGVLFGNNNDATMDTSNVQVKNNAFIRSNQGVAFSSGDHANTQISYNLYSSVSGGAPYSNSSNLSLPGLQATNNVTNVAPGFNLSGGIPDPYYRPSAATAGVVDRGTTNVGGDAVTYNGTAPDIGRYEWGGVTPPPPTDTLPSGWTSTNVGNAAPNGSATFNASTQVYTVNGGGADIWGTSDQFQFASQLLAGDGALSARVTGQTNTDGWAKAGVMMRASTAANAAFAAVVVTPSNGTRLQYRTAAGAQAQDAGAGNNNAYVRLVRTGDNVQAFSSADGTTWTGFGPIVNLGTGSLLAGLAATSHNTSALSTVTFANFSMYTGSGTLINVATGGTAGASSQNSGSNEGAAQAFDNNPATKWLALTNTATLSYTFADAATYTVTQYKLTSGNDTAIYTGRAPKNWTLQGLSGSTWVTLDTRTNEADTANGSTRTYTVATPGAYNQYRLNISANNGDPGLIQLGELQLMAAGSGTQTSAKLTGTAIGTAGSYGGGGNTISKVFDGNVNSYFDAPDSTGGNGAWVGLDLGSAKTINQIKFAPRAGFAGRMVGGQFQVSNTADFASATTIFTVASAPTEGSLTTQSVAVSGTWRYIRYLPPNGGWGNIAELEAYGF
ncbi:MAG TPA: discoidin domain-containing protein [Tepidisphaeraceae bacterium]|jgi:hypothetical protein|nr:discoidin domain-containing protein [Tepidisphaeraceae bacterium]